MFLVWVIRLELTTSASRTLRATNCATPRIALFYHISLKLSTKESKYAKLKLNEEDYKICLSWFNYPPRASLSILGNERLYGALGL